VPNPGADSFQTGMSRKRAVFLDRDGVLNAAILRDGVPHPPSSVSDTDILPDVPESCERLRHLGFLLIVVTNQPDIARGRLGPPALEEIHSYLRTQLPLDSIWVCPHDDGDGCSCRKPAPGLILKAAIHHDVDVARSYMVGDRWRDMDAGRAAGCRTILVRNPLYRERPAEGADVEVESLSEAVDWIVSVDRHNREEIS
jgi:D-glycero-D-manno-heptose 1,7-bisphosphate phosphatase